jgi:2-methylisocitrate lyase-like PEP mutase family enzyme
VTTPDHPGTREPVTAPGLAVTSAERNRVLAGLIAADGPPLLLPGVSDAIWAKLCAMNGAAAVYVSGAGITNTYYGLADTGLISFPEMLAHVERIVEAVTVPVVVDADTGYGGLTSVSRTAALLERAGASAIQIEDQASPKRCGHFYGKRLVTTSEMQERIDAIVRTRRDPGFLVIARTDARAVEGIDAAIERASRYIEAGADVIFVEAPQTLEEIKQIPSQLGSVPLLFNVVEGGHSPVVSRNELAALGYRIVLYANFLLRTMLKAGAEALLALQDSPGEQLEDGLLSWQDRQSLVRLPQLDAFEDDIRSRWQRA